MTLRPRGGEADLLFMFPGAAGQQAADGRESGGKTDVAFLFQLIQAMRKFFMRRYHFAQPGKSADHGNANMYGLLRIQDIGALYCRIP